jgi:hypothetical protein
VDHDEHVKFLSSKRGSVPLPLLSDRESAPKSENGNSSGKKDNEMAKLRVFDREKIRT